jgi:hypothetical protein
MIMVRIFTDKDIKASVAVRQARAAQCAARRLSKSYRRAALRHCGPLQRASRSAGFPAARGGKWSAVQVMRLLEVGRPFDGASVAAA